MKNTGSLKFSGVSSDPEATRRAGIHGMGKGFSCATVPRWRSSRCEVSASPGPSKSSMYVSGPNAYALMPMPYVE